MQLRILKLSGENWLPSLYCSHKINNIPVCVDLIPGSGSSVEQQQEEIRLDLGQVCANRGKMSY